MKNNDLKKSGDMPPSSREKIKCPTLTQPPYCEKKNTTTSSSEGATLFQQGYMRRKDIRKILREEEMRNDT